MHRAAKEGEDCVVQRLILAGADVHARGERDRTALHEAAENGDLDMVGRLLEAGAEVDARDENGHTPLQDAVGGWTADARLVTILLEAGAEPDAPDTSGVSPLRAARWALNAEIIPLLEAATHRADAAPAGPPAEPGSSPGP